VLAALLLLISIMTLLKACLICSRGYWINGLAKIYKDQGLRVSVCNTEGNHNEIKQKLIETTGLHKFFTLFGTEKPR
jgi:hypothetical protein